MKSGTTTSRLVLGAAAVGLLAHAVHDLAGSDGGGLDRFFDTWVFLTLALAAVIAVVARAVLVTDDRGIWTPAAVAMSAWFIGSAYYVSSTDPGTFLSTVPADLLLCFVVPVALALGHLVRRRVQPFQPTILLDGLIVSVAVAALVAMLLKLGLDHGGFVQQPSSAKLAYPTGSVLLLAFSVWVVGLTGWRSDRSWMLLVGGLGLLAGTSTAFVLMVARGSHAPGGPLDTLWLAGALAIGLLAWQQHAEPLQIRLEASRRIAATSAAALVALAMLVAGQFVELSVLGIALAAVALVATVVRAAVSFKESVVMFADARKEAQTDSLTGLGNRRLLMTDLRREIEAASVESPRVLVMFDLDGFKRYNDTYGHPAGDALLARLGASLGRAIRPYGGAYRIGGDEFCVLVMTGASSAKMIIALAAAALSEQGEGFNVRASHGAVILPHEARDATLALRISDQRMYAHKDDRRSSATRQTRDILLQVLQEREPELGDHLKGVAKLALGVGSRLELVTEQLDEIVRAAELHDVGKMAIPDEILRKPGPLTDGEWAFVKQHTIIGERILSAAPALLPVAKLVRASHEHYDGSGYPDGLAGDQIPLGARIVAVCDAFDAMTSGRPYRPAITAAEALAELRACSGAQFDPAVVKAFCDELASLGPRYSERAASLR